MQGFEWILLIFIGMICLSFLINLFRFFGELFNSADKALHDKKQTRDYSDPRWTGKL